MASPTSPQSTTLPTRASTLGSEDAIPDEDSTETTRLFDERLAAWRHACAYLEDYVKATEKSEKDTAKEYERVLKTVNSPLKQGHHFHQQNGGIAELFDNIRTNTQGIANSHSETSKTLKGSVLPIFERLHSEIKNKGKELNKGAGKASKAVEKARNASQKQIELLGQHAAAFDARGGNIKASEDPYILQRGVYHRLNRQVIEENNNREDLIAVQDNFASFESHILSTLQTGLGQFNQVMANQQDQTRNMYGDMLGTAQRIPPDFEWKGFMERNNHLLINPNGPKRSVENIAFANQDHHSTRPLIAGSLERKGKMLKRYDTGYYVVTPSRYLHEFKTDDDFAKDPSAENSLYLPDCLIGAVDGVKFNIKGKDVGKGTFGNKMSMSHEFAFKAHTPEDAKKWHDVIASVSGGTSSAPSSAPSSPQVGNTSTMSPTSPSSMTTGTTGTEASTEKPPLEQEHSPAGEHASPAESPSPTSATSPTTAAPATEKKANDYAPL